MVWHGWQTYIKMATSETTSTSVFMSLKNTSYFLISILNARYRFFTDKINDLLISIMNGRNRLSLVK